jgi:hypothetical protein
MARRKHSEEELPFVALMDTMTNVVGVLIIVLVMIGIGLARSVNKVLSELPPVRSWPEAGKSPDAVHREKNFVGDFLCVRRFDPERKRVCAVTTSRNRAGPDCGPLGPGNRYATFDAEGWYIAYLFNNGIAIVSQMEMWGNHGQSDPSNFYVPLPAGARACPHRIAPSSR